MHVNERLFGVPKNKFVRNKNENVDIKFSAHEMFLE
jgi:hypothetical protein